MRASGIPGTPLKWTIAACQGPLGPWPEFREERGRWLTARYGFEGAAGSQTLQEQDAALLRAARLGETLVFWCEADPYDLADLAAAVAFLRRMEPETRLELVLLDSHPEVNEFWGLNQLTPQQLADCFIDRRVIGPAERDALLRAWEALCAGAIACRDLGRETLALPFLADAMARLGEEAIGVDGFGLTERRLVEAVGNEPLTAIDLFRRTQRAERRAWLGDSMVFAIIDDLAARTSPPIWVAPPGAMLSGGEALVGAL